MYRILLVASFPPSQFLRQTRDGSGRWGACRFLTDPKDGPFDAVVVYDECPRVIDCECPPENTLLITGEPPSMRRYRRPYTAQFAHVWTSHRSISHPRLRLGHEGQPWHYGLYPSRAHGAPLNYDQLAALPAPRKTKLCSVICSSKAITADQRQRLSFMELLRRELGDQIDFFGRGISPLDDKADAIYDYRYHIVLENDHSQFYMSEKLTDAFLGWSFPLYFGGAEADHRFAPGSFVRIDIHRPEVALGVVRDVLQHDVYEHQLERVAEARNNVLDQLNVMAMLARFWEQNMQSAPAARLRLRPKNHATALALNYVGRVLRGGRQAA